MRRYVTGTFPSFQAASHGVDELVRAGISPNDVTVEDLARGAILVTVRVSEERRAKVQRLLERSGAVRPNPAGTQARPH